MSIEVPSHVIELGCLAHEKRYGMLFRCKCGNSFDMVFSGIQRERSHKICMYAAIVEGWFLSRQNDIAVCPTCRRMESKTEQTGGSQNE